MNIFINGQAIKMNTTEEFTVVSEALALYITDEKKNSTYAVALNGTFVNKQTYASTTIKENDALDVLFPIVGG